VSVANSKFYVDILRNTDRGSLLSLSLALGGWRFRYRPYWSVSLWFDLLQRRRLITVGRRPNRAEQFSGSSIGFQARSQSLVESRSQHQERSQQPASETPPENQRTHATSFEQLFCQFFNEPDVIYRLPDGGSRRMFEYALGAKGKILNRDEAAAFFADHERGVSNQ
jgi:hypothetical protein